MNDLGGMAVAVKYRGVRVRERGRIGEDGFATYGFGRFPSRVSLGVPERGQSRTEKRGLVVYLPDAPYPRRRILLAALDNYTHGTPTLAAVARIPNQTRAVTGAPKNPARNALPLLRAVAGFLLETLDKSGQASAERVWGVSGGGWTWTYIRGEAARPLSLPFFSTHHTRRAHHYYRYRLGPQSLLSLSAPIVNLATPLVVALPRLSLVAVTQVHKILLSRHVVRKLVRSPGDFAV